jgi:hypothetical protein
MCACSAAGGNWFWSGAERNGLKPQVGGFSLVIGPTYGLIRLPFAFQPKCACVPLLNTAPQYNRKHQERKSDQLRQRHYPPDESSTMIIPKYVQ